LPSETDGVLIGVGVELFEEPLSFAQEIADSTPYICEL